MKISQKCCITLIILFNTRCFYNYKWNHNFILQLPNEKINSGFLEKHRIGSAFTRSGKLSPAKLIYFLLHTSLKSISINYSQFLYFFSCEIPPFVSKQEISLEVFLDLFHLSVEQFYSMASNLHTEWFSYLYCWRQYHTDYGIRKQL